MPNNMMQLMAMLSQSQNPIALLNQTFGNNPKFHQVMEIAKGKSPEELRQYALNICSTQGIDILRLAKQFNIPLK